MKQKIIFILIAALLASVGAAGGYFYQHNKSKTEIQGLQNEKQNQQKQIEDLQKEVEELKKEKEVLEQTADWKTFEHLEYSYSIKYPQDWIVTEIKDTSQMDYDPGDVILSCFGLDQKLDKDFYSVTIRQHENPSSLSLAAYAKQQPYIADEDGELKEITIGNLDALRFSAYIGMGREITTPMILIAKKNKIYSIGLFSNRVDQEDQIKVFDKIVETFKAL